MIFFPVHLLIANVSLNKSADFSQVHYSISVQLDLCYKFCANLTTVGFHLCLFPINSSFRSKQR